MPKIALIYGTRPEAVKMAPLVLALRTRRDVVTRVIVTGQHRELLDQAHGELGTEADVDLQLMSRAGLLGDFAGRALAALTRALAAEAPDLVLVHGDTASSFAGALAAFYERRPVGHVEAGLRSGDLGAPFPEEAHRVLTARLAALHFAPTEMSRARLVAEGVPAERIYVTGNTVADALQLALQRLAAEPLPPAPWTVGWEPLVVVTSHRRENLGRPLEDVAGAVLELARRFPVVRFLVSLHPNPKAREPFVRLLGGGALRNVFLVEPLGYLRFVDALSRAALVLTDSGGVPEEAAALGKPVLLLRDRSERTAAELGPLVQLVGTGREAVVAAAARELETAAVPGPKTAFAPLVPGPTDLILAHCLAFLGMQRGARSA